MVFDVRLTSDPEQQAAMANFIKTHPGAGIAVLPVMASTLTIDKPLGSKDGTVPLAGFFKEINLEEKAGRAEDELGGTAVLTDIGARALKSCVDSTSKSFKDYWNIVVPAYQNAVKFRELVKIPSMEEK